MIIAAALLSCTPQTRHRVLSLLFDGVPPPGSASAPEPTVAQLMLQSEPDTPISGEASVQWASVHRPYAEGRCGQCHVGLLTDVLVSTDLSQCLRCHGDTALSEGWDHGPTALGQCRICHEAHVSIHPRLQTESQPGLCVRCHDSADLMTAIAAHSGQGNRDCTQCHDPHRGSVR